MRGYQARKTRRGLGRTRTRWRIVPARENPPGTPVVHERVAPLQWCAQTGKVFPGGGLRDSCHRRRNRPRRASKTKNCGQKKLCFCVDVEKTLHRARFFEKYSYVPVLLIDGGAVKKNTWPQYEKNQTQPPGTTFSNFSDKVTVPRGHQNCCRFDTM